MTNMLRVVVVAAAFALAACAAMQQQKAQPVRTDEGEFKNLKVLPQNITHDELIATMRGFARSLGVKCNHCHVPIPGTENKFEFPSDAKPEKKIARTMILMTRNINGNYISKVPHGIEERDEQSTGKETHEHGEEHEHVTVTCYTCHRGHVLPEQNPPAEAPQARPGA
jgi:photosynthetic reaction center cytochrome c subunit